VANAEETWFSAVVEGDVDEAVLNKIADRVGVRLGAVFGRNGKHSIYQRLSAYNNAARFSPWIILLDLDHDAPCAPSLVSQHMPQPSPFLCFRIAVRAIESWLLADRNAFAAFLGVKRDALSNSPDLLDDPKGFVVDLARNSRKKLFRRELVPRPGSRKRVGPAYTSRMMEFSLYHWDPVRAEALSGSLRRCRTGITELLQKANEV